MAAVPHIDAAIGRLDGARREAGLPGLEPPSDVASIDAIAADVAPYALPAELRRFWEQVDPEPVAIYTFPMLRGPAYSLELLHGLRELEAVAPMRAPPLLLPIDYASHCYAMIELGSEWGDGGTIFEWEFDAVSVVAHGLADRIDLLATLIAEGHLERGEDFVTLDHPVERDRRAARLDAAAPHPMYGVLHAVPPELESWPAHWLAASGIDLRSRAPMGATHSIAELVAAADHGASHGRIHALVTSLFGSTDGSLVVVDDGSASLEVWCPSGTSPWGPVHGRRFELEVTIAGPSNAPSAAIATDVRPLD